MKPRARAWDETGEFPWEVVRELGLLGLMGIAVPEEYGGAGLGALAVAVVIEELAPRRLARAHRGEPQRARHRAHPPLRQQEQRRRYLRRSPGEKLAAWG